MSAWATRARRRFFTLGALLAAVLAVVLGTLLIWDKRTQLDNLELQDLQRQLNFRVQGLSAWVQDQGKKLTFYEGFINLPKQEFIEILLRHQKTTSSVRNLYLFDLDKRALFTTETQQGLRYNWVKEDWVGRAYKEFSRSVISTFGPMDTPFIRIGVPLKNKNREVVYILVAELDLAEAEINFSRQMGPKDLVYGVVPGRHWLFRPHAIRELPATTEFDYIDMALLGESYQGSYKNIKDLPVLGVYYFDPLFQVAFFMERIKVPWGWSDYFPLGIIFLGAAIFLGYAAVFWRQAFKPLGYWNRVFDMDSQLDDFMELGKVLPPLGRLWEEYEGDVRKAFQLREVALATKRKEVQHLKKILDFSPDLDIEISLEGRIISANEWGCQHLEIHPEDILGKTLDEITPEMKPLHLKLPLLLHAPQGYRFYSWVKLAGEEQRLLESALSHIPGDSAQDTRHFLAIRDVTKRFLSGENTRHQKKMESLFNFSAGVVQDFSNLLAGITGKVALAHLDAEKGLVNPALLEEVQDMILSAKKLMGDLVAVGAGGVFAVEKVEAYSVLLPLLKGLETQGCKIFMNLIPQGPQIQADGVKLELVFKEILDNAREFGKNKPIRVNTSLITVPQAGPADGVKTYLRVGIHDQGPGIPKENLERVYDPYFSTVPGRKGLGLTVAYSLLSRMGGYMEIESEPGSGTEFRLFFLVSDQKPLPTARTLRTHF